MYHGTIFYIVQLVDLSGATVYYIIMNLGKCKNDLKNSKNALEKLLEIYVLIRVFVYLNCVLHIKY